ncbi:hypothetical protein [Caldinitratiruptor microaerophilus]|uniref:Uncharacterized protein n=1 Tax=Caldinitratiruptor microaerophilus TaxID=671077 RepID=A0AA35CNU3_9FIRM|nr:hypothetical protein [Caldinitratiruptor microaerophilus]BDG61944.1 hypothetical protein caldi_30340 [Caldinitratiruptor microaerophilus]
MQFWVRPYNPDAGLLEDAMTEGFRPHGVMLDANIAAAYPNVLKRIQSITERLELAIDPNTAKIRTPYFRNKPTYKRLPYFSGNIPALLDLIHNAEDIVQVFTDLQINLGASVLLSPYFLLEESHFPSSAQLDVQRAWYAHFFRITKTTPVYASLCITAQAIATPEGFHGALELLQPHHPERVYLLLADFELGQDLTLDETVVNFFRSLQEIGIREILFGRGPAWATLLFPFGLSGYVSGINYMASLRREYFTRDEEISGIQHNYYLPRRFVRAEPRMVEQIYAEELMGPCDCPVCAHGVPFDVNGIRRHYLFARGREATEVAGSSNPRLLLREWVKDTGDLLMQANALNIDIIGHPPVDRWARLLA